MTNFNHKFVPAVTLKSEMIGDSRFYILPSGKKVKSVTTILGEKMDKSALENWKARVGEEEAGRVSSMASKRGNAIHNMAEKYIMNDSDIFKDQMPFNIQTFKTIQRVLDKHITDIFGIELSLYSSALNTAGKTDLVALYDGIPSIIDFKTSKRLKTEEWIESYFIQTTVYSMMFEWIYKISIPQIVIMIAVDHENEAQVFVKDRAKYINRVFELFTK
jgi:genome maintenance exonuclease 1